MRVFLTGGAGYIGSHTAVALIEAGFEVVLFDNYYNSKPEVLKRIQMITGKPVDFVYGDIEKKRDIDKALERFNCSAVIHLAGLKAVEESVMSPLDYYKVNVGGTLNLLEVMKKRNIKILVFSSSATVYGLPRYLPVDENHVVSSVQPYGRTKQIAEEFLTDLHHADAEWRIGILRYFNPVGAHYSGLIGENPLGKPNNLMPYITQVAAGNLPFLNIWGDNYPTLDGTGVRDYIHVMDVANGHIKALTKLTDDTKSVGLFKVNLGTGKGYSVLEVIRAFEKISQRPIPFHVCDRRSGDVAEIYADADLAENLLGWKAEMNLVNMCRDCWNWQLLNPTGYSDLEST